MVAACHNKVQICKLYYLILVPTQLTYAPNTVIWRSYRDQLVFPRNTPGVSGHAVVSYVHIHDEISEGTHMFKIPLFKPYKSYLIFGFEFLTFRLTIHATRLLMMQAVSSGLQGIDGMPLTRRGAFPGNILSATNLLQGKFIVMVLLCRCIKGRHIRPLYHHL